MTKPPPSTPIEAIEWSEGHGRIVNALAEYDPPITTLEELIRFLRFPNRLKFMVHNLGSKSDFIIKQTLDSIGWTRDEINAFNADETKRSIETQDQRELEFLMVVVSKFAFVNLRAKHAAADFYERVSKACADKAASLRADVDEPA